MGKKLLVIGGGPQGQRLQPRRGDEILRWKSSFIKRKKRSPMEGADFPTTSMDLSKKEVNWFPGLRVISPRTGYES